MCPKFDNSDSEKSISIPFNQFYMSNKAKNILTLNHEEAMDFFMKSEQYHGFELPEYFTFDEVLKYVRETIDEFARVLKSMLN